MRGNGHVGHAEETPGSDFGDLKAIEVLQIHLRQDPLQRALYPLFPEKPEIHRLDFRSHEKEVPSRSMDRVVEVTGIVTTFQDRPQIVVSDPTQIKWGPAPTPKATPTPAPKSK